MRWPQRKDYKKKVLKMNSNKSVDKEFSQEDTVKNPNALWLPSG
jgi:hypothetical protein